MRPAPRAPLRAVVAMVVGLALLASGCGGDDDFADAPRPPTEITISAAITPARVSVSPSRIGAGPIALLASNQTTTSQRVTVRSDPGAPNSEPLNQTTGPINPGDTASLKADLAPGSYIVTASGASIAPARIAIGPPRPSGGEARPLQP